MLRKSRRIAWRMLRVGVGVAIAYVVVAYIVAPELWRGYARRHPALENIPRITYAADGHPGDPLNVALIGPEGVLKKGMLAAGWYPADALTWKSCLEIASATVFDRKYDEAPVSNLYLAGRKEDLAFERPVGENPRERHHVRFWRSGEDGGGLWMGAATYDRKVGLSHTTGQITHHIAADVDAERDAIVGDLDRAGALAERWYVNDFHAVLTGKNGGGDVWRTDGRLLVGVLAEE